MEFHRQPQFPRYVKDPRDLGRLKGDALAESIDRIDQPLGMGGA